MSIVKISKYVLHIMVIVINNSSKMDVAPWCYKWIELDCVGWYLGGVKYRAPYGASYGANKRNLGDEPQIGSYAGG